MLPRPIDSVLPSSLGENTARTGLLSQPARRLLGVYSELLARLTLTRPLQRKPAKKSIVSLWPILSWAKTVLSLVATEVLRATPPVMATDLSLPSVAMETRLWLGISMVSRGCSIRSFFR